MVEIVGTLPSAGEIKKISRRNLIRGAIASGGAGVLMIATGGEILKNNPQSQTRKDVKAPQATPTERLKLGENLIKNPGLELNPAAAHIISENPSPDSWTFKPSNQHIKVSETARTPFGQKCIEIEGFYNEKNQFQTPVLETAGSIPVDISDPRFDYKVSFKANVPSGFIPVIAAFPTIPDYSPDGNYKKISHIVPFAFENNSPGQWGAKPYEITINNSLFPKVTEGVVLQFSMIRSSAVAPDQKSRNTAFFGEFSVNEVANPLRGKHPASA